MNNLTLIEQLAFSTIRIECDVPGGVSTGTGFFFRFADKKTEHVPAIVTNKHVIAGAQRGRLFFTTANADGSPNVGDKFLWTVENFEKAWIPHPDADVDLCVMPIANLLTEALGKGKNLFHIAHALDLLPSKEDIDDMIGMEKIVMVGYPNGIWDQTNNFPVFRQGALATNFRYDWNGRAEFLIDAACFPGSSGSPVLQCDIGQVHNRKGLQIGPSRIKLLGILYAGPYHSVEGKVKIVPIPTKNDVISISKIPNNLGMVIKSHRLLAFDKIFYEKTAK